MPRRSAVSTAYSSTAVSPRPAAPPRNTTCPVPAAAAAASLLGLRRLMASRPT